jgi:hypothetical protein
VHALRAWGRGRAAVRANKPYDENAVAIFSKRGTQLGYVSAERAPLIGKRMKEGEAIAVFQAMHGAEPTSGSGSEVVCLPCPTPSPMF